MGHSNYFIENVKIQGLFPVFPIFFLIPGYVQVLEDNDQIQGYFPESGRRGSMVYNCSTPTPKHDPQYTDIFIAVIVSPHTGSLPTDQQLKTCRQMQYFALQYFAVRQL